MTPQEQEAINQAKANRKQSRSTNSTQRTVDPSQGVSQLAERLDPMREEVAQFTEKYVLEGGIALGLQRITSGNWGYTSLEILENFQSSLSDFRQTNGFALAPAESKKMLSGASVVEVE